MRIRIEKRYLAVPTSKYATRKRLCFYECGPDDSKLVMDYDCKVDLIAPDFTAYIDVSRFLGKELEYSSIPEMDLTLEQTDQKKIEPALSDPFRPFSHYTTQMGWQNDPNGPILYHGVYHMFYQHNPYGTCWGNMHWGHATSRDLLHWEEQEIALFPDEMGTMYSGSAIEDVHNLTGLQEGDNPPMLLFYTAAGDRTLLSKDKKRPQCMAYSTDGGKTFRKYKGNPVLGWIENYNRDPKVVWVEELNRYVMVIYLVGDRYCLLTSENFLQWTPLQEIVLENDSECPDMMSFVVNRKKYWVISGGSDKYIVGVFEKGKFVQKTMTKQLSYSPSRTSYAAQSFSGVEGGRVIRVIWDRLNSPSKKAPNQIGVPVEMKLICRDRDFLLTALPVAELEQLRAESFCYDRETITEPVRIPLKKAAYDITLEADYQSDISLEIFGHEFNLKTEENCIEFGKTKFPLSLDMDRIKLRMIVDRSSFELFADDGKFCATFSALCDYNLPYMRVTSKQEVSVQKLNCYRLESIYPTTEVDDNAR